MRVDVAAAVASAAPPLSACNERAWEGTELGGKVEHGHGGG